MKTIGNPNIPVPPVQEISGNASITLHDVARHAGVSISTVSRALNGTTRVSDAKSQAVMKAVKALDFRLNLAARGLKVGSSMTLGILIQDLESAYFTRLMKGIEIGLAGSGYVPIIVSGHWDAFDEAKSVSLLMARQVDGLIVVGGHLSDELIVQFSRHQPVVVVGRQLKAERVMAFGNDQEYGGYIATKHLLELGHKHIAFISGPQSQTDAIERRDGYFRALREAGIQPQASWIADGDFVEAGGHAAMMHFLQTCPEVTAVFASNDQSAYGARMALYRSGKRIPHDISLVGIDNLPASANMTPPLTTVHQPIFESGMYAAQGILMMMGFDVPSDKRVPTPPALRLILRESCAPPQTR